MSLRETLRTIRSNDYFTEEMAAAMTIPPNPFGSRRADRKRGPIPQWTDEIRANVAPSTARALKIAASRRSISFAALVRQIFDAWLKQNPEAWQ
jgi:hypothetical protein